MSTDRLQPGMRDLLNRFSEDFNQQDADLQQVVGSFLDILSMMKPSPDVEYAVRSVIDCLVRKCSSPVEKPPEDVAHAFATGYRLAAPGIVSDDEVATAYTAYTASERNHV